MTVNRLSFYNNALLMAGERALSSLTEAREPRRLLDQVWDTGGVKKCLEQGQWKYAMRTVMLDYDPDLSPSFGYSRAFNKPSDWVVTSAVCTDAYFRTPLLQYFDEAGYWYADLDTIYVRYVSDDDQYGLDLARWPGSFEDFAASFFALRISAKLAASETEIKKLTALHRDLKKIALNKDAMADPSKILPPGMWSRSRLRNTGRDDLGYRTGDLY
ncbi:MAG: hypothetical protein VW362_10645 [Candidatus Nanopelagicales bacterium]